MTHKIIDAKILKTKEDMMEIMKNGVKKEEFNNPELDTPERERLSGLKSAENSNSDSGEESLDEKIELVERKYDVGMTEMFLKRNVKEKIQEFLSELKEELDKLNRKGTHTIFMRDGVIDKLALKKFGGKIIK